MRAVVAIAVLLTGCGRYYYTSDVNAPGDVTLAPPAREDGSRTLYVEPSDPGEYELYAAPGVIAGPVAGRRASDADPGVELGFFLRLAFHSNDRSHTEKQFPYPLSGWTATVGWSPLQTGTDVDVGPLYAEIERRWLTLVVGVGPAIYPDDGNAGVQATFAAGPYGVRLRYMAETGWEVAGAFQFELPRAYAWSR